MPIDEKFQIWGDDPEEYNLSMDPDKDGAPGITPRPRMKKFINQIPKEVRKIPTPENRDEIMDIISGYGIWFLVNYGSHLISFVCGFCATVFGKIVGLRTGIKQKRIPLIDKLIGDK